MRLQREWSYENFSAHAFSEGLQPFPYILRIGLPSYSFAISRDVLRLYTSDCPDILGLVSEVQK